MEGADSLALPGGRVLAGTALGEVELPLLEGSAVSPTVAGQSVFSPYAATSNASAGLVALGTEDLIYYHQTGGTATTNGNSIAVDSAGNAYVTGNTNSADFPITAGAYDTFHNGGTTAFVTRLNLAGDGLVYSTFFGSSSSEYGFAIAASDAGRAYIYGSDSGGAFVAALQAGEAVPPTPAPDTVPPAAVTDLSATTGPAIGSITLTWTAPGDDGNTGTAALYLVRRSGAAITGGNWAAATPVTVGVPSPASAGTRQSMTVTGLTSGQTYYFALKAQDEVPNLSPISNGAQAVAAQSSLYRVYVPEAFRGQ